MGLPSRLLLTLVRKLTRRLDGMENRIYFRSNESVQDFVGRNQKLWNSLREETASERRIVLSEVAHGLRPWDIRVSTTATLVSIANRARTLYVNLSGISSHGYPMAFVQESFGACDYLEITEDSARLGVSLEEAVDELYGSLKQPEDLLDLSYRGVPIGEQVYDGVLKYNQASVWEINERVREELVKAVQSVHLVQYLDREYELCAGCFSHTSCSSFGVMTRALLAAGKPVYQSAGGLSAMMRYNRMDDFRGQIQPHVYVPKAQFEMYQADRAFVSEARDYMEKRQEGSTDEWEVNAAFGSHKKTYREKHEFCKAFGLDPNKPCVFIMLHAMCDDPHMFPQNFFRDYYHWFEFTLEEALKLGDANWIFKQHPLYAHYKEDANLPGIFRFIDRENILYLDESVTLSSATVRYCADAVITSAGAAALEFAAFGVPGIVVCRNHYSEHGIVHLAKDLEGYRELLASIGELPKPTQAQQERAATLFYLIYSVLIRAFDEGLLPNRDHTAIKTGSWEDTIHWLNESFEGESLERIRQRIRDEIDFVRNVSSEHDCELYLRRN